MSPGISLSLHWYRGFGLDAQQDLFFLWRFRLGFVTVALERVDWLTAYRKLRADIVARVEHDREGR